MTRKIPAELAKFIDKYFTLNVAGMKVICPYYMNVGGILKDSVFAGKGSPVEIENKAKDIFSHIDLVNKDENFIRSEMSHNDLGIDCSGLVYQILNTWLRDISKKSELKDYLPKSRTFNPRRIISRMIKPQSSVSADMFTSSPISKKIDLKDVQPGDLIRTRGGKHILFVTEVEYNDTIPTKITFVQSASLYKRTGVRYGSVELIKKMDLACSIWSDANPEEENHTYKGYRTLMDNNGIFRPELPLEISTQWSA